MGKSKTGGKKCGNAATLCTHPFCWEKAHSASKNVAASVLGPWKTTNSSGFEVAHVVIDSAFIVDLVWNFFVYFWDDYGNLEMRARKTAANYAKSRFLFDLITSFPFDVLPDSLPYGTKNALRYVLHPDLGRLS
uniref:Uncharacterized protein n=1 Tax=Palpitomonas bilix TaxID=652834 RepID=A0A7S3DHN9_9EUKA|mmetsp:Transcript_38165/g.98514  ORF Transcript_38165/g.98514 Transcript_38165/m.98514 type:complete len:134 (+) Transcript_38165:34-435(+)